MQIGCFETRTLKSLVVKVPPDSSDLQVSLFATGGRGVFREMKFF